MENKQEILDKIQADEANHIDIRQVIHDRRTYEREHYRQTMFDAEKQKQQLIEAGLIEKNPNR